MNNIEYHFRNGMHFLVVGGMFLLSACAEDNSSTLPTEQPSPPTATVTARPQPTPYLTATLPPDVESEVGEGWRIYLVEPDGENLQHLTESGKDYRYPQFSPDGAQVAFIEEGDEDYDSLVAYRLDTQKMEILFEVGGTIKDYAWAPGSERIAVLVQAEENIAYLTLFDFESGMLKDQLVWDGRLSSVSWSYDGKYLAFAGSEPALDFTPSMMERVRTEIYIFDMAEGQLTQLTATDGLSFAPEWSPTEYALAYIKRTIEIPVSDSLHLIYPYETDRIDSELAKMAFFFSLSWSPDGEQIAYGGGTSANAFNVHDGTNYELIGGAGSFSPTSWSPDSRIVVTGAWCCSQELVYLLDTEKIGSEDPAERWTRLLGTKVKENHLLLVGARWSPVEDLIVFAGLWYPPMP